MTKQVIYGLISVVLGYFLQTYSPVPLFMIFISSVIFIILLMLIGKSNMTKKPSAEQMHIWNFSFLFVLIVTLVVLYGNTFMPSAPAPRPEYIISYWFVVFGATMVLSGSMEKRNGQTFIGILWLFSAMFIALFSLGYHYFYAGVLFGLPFIIDGLLRKR